VAGLQNGAAGTLQFLPAVQATGGSGRLLCSVSVPYGGSDSAADVLQHASDALSADAACQAAGLTPRFLPPFQPQGGEDQIPRPASLALDASILDQRPRLGAYGEGRVIVGIRPESIQDAALVPDAPRDHLLHGTVELREALGPELFIHFTAPRVELADTETIADLPRDTGIVGMNADAGAMLVGRFSAHSEAREGAAIDAVVDTRELHFFDPETGRGIYGSDETEHDTERVGDKRLSS